MIKLIFPMVLTLSVLASSSYAKTADADNLAVQTAEANYKKAAADLVNARAAQSAAYEKKNIDDWNATLSKATSEMRLAVLRLPSCPKALPNQIQCLNFIQGMMDRGEITSPTQVLDIDGRGLLQDTNGFVCATIVTTTDRVNPIIYKGDNESCLR